MPLLAALDAHVSTGRLSFHMPGHRAGQSWPASLVNRFALLDTTELAVTDDLHQPTGPARQAMSLAATCFGAAETFFLTNGSTGGILAMLAGLVGRDQPVILPRTCHQSVMQALALLDLEPVWIEWDESQADQDGVFSNRPTFGLIPTVTPAAIAAAIASRPDCRAVVLTYPDYYGSCADLAAIAPIAHAAGMLLLIDEAHGAHLAAAPDVLPPTALAAGADACVQSAHKTLPALTQGAYLHLAKRLVSSMPDAVAQVRTALRVFMTSSPSFPIAASLDYARAYLAADGSHAVQQLLREIEWLGQELTGLVRVSPPNRWVDGCFRDPCRLVLDWPIERGTAVAAASRLNQVGIDVEMADLSRLVLIPALDQPHDDFVRLAAAIRAECLGSEGGSVSETHRLELEQQWAAAMMTAPVRAEQPSNVWLRNRPSEFVPVAESVGRIAATAISPYPPGIALIIPGERIDTVRLDLLIRLRDNGINLSGISGEMILVLHA